MRLWRTPGGKREGQGTRQWNNGGGVQGQRWAGVDQGKGNSTFPSCPAPPKMISCDDTQTRVRVRSVPPYLVHEHMGTGGRDSRRRHAQCSSDSPCAKRLGSRLRLLARVVPLPTMSLTVAPWCVRVSRRRFRASACCAWRWPIRDLRLLDEPSRATMEGTASDGDDASTNWSAATSSRPWRRAQVHGKRGADEAEATPVVAREAALGARASLLWLQEPASFDIRPPCLLVAGNAEPACFRSPTTPERLSPVRSCSLPRFLREYRQDAEIGGHKWSRGWIFIASLDNDRGIALPWWR